MYSVVTERYGRLLNTGLYFHQPDGKMDISLVKSAMDDKFFKVKLVIIQNPYNAIVDYQPNENSASDYWLRVFSGPYPVQLGRNVETVPVECYRLDKALPFHILHDAAFVAASGISLMGLVPTDQIIKNAQFQTN